MSLKHTKCIRGAYATILSLLIMLASIPPVYADTKPAFPNCNGLALDRSYLYQLSTMSGGSTDLTSTDPSVTILLFYVPTTNSSYFINTAGYYAYLLDQGSAHVNLWATGSTQGNWWLDFVANGTQTSNGRAILINNLGFPTQTVLANGPVPTSMKSTQISCLTVMKGTVTQTFYTSNGLHAATTPTQWDVTSTAPFASPTVATTGITFAPDPNAQSSSTGGSTSGGGTTVVNAGDVTKDYLHQLAIKLCAGAIAVFLSWEFIKAFRWRGND